MMKRKAVPEVTPTLLDLWEQLTPVFVSAPIEMAEMEISGLDPMQMRQCVRHLLSNARTFIGSRIILAANGAQVMLSSPHAAINLLAQQIIYGAFFLKVEVDGYTLPEMAYFFDTPRMMAIGFATGTEWTPLNIAAFWELLRVIYSFAPQTEIRLNPDLYDEATCNSFDALVKELLYVSP